MNAGSLIAKCWRTLRQISGDDAYERYLEHWRLRHAHEDAQPLTRQEFYSIEQERKWNGVRRCC
jgi:uncharacterized short protein YbdD (DUF466 family)